MSFVTCEHCGNQLKNISSLEYHKKNSKKCLKLQNNNESLVNCEFCEKEYSKNNLIKHIKICKLKKEHEIEVEKKEEENKSNDINILKNRILLLENELKIYKNLYEEKNNVVVDLAKEPKNKTNHNNNKINVNNNSYFNYFDEPDKMKEIISKNLTIEHIIDGQKGVAEFAQQYLLTDKDGDPNYFCSDVSRNSFKYKTKNGDLEKDNKAVKLTKLMINNGLKNTTIQKASQIWTNEDGSQDSDKYHLHSESAQEIVNLGEDNTKFRNHLASIISK